jgi:hypothetical protein
MVKLDIFHRRARENLIEGAQSLPFEILESERFGEFGIVAATTTSPSLIATLLILLDNTACEQQQHT